MDDSVKLAGYFAKRVFVFRARSAVDGCRGGCRICCDIGGAVPRITVARFKSYVFEGKVDLFLRVSLPFFV